MSHFCHAHHMLTDDECHSISESIDHLRRSNTELKQLLYDLDLMTCDCELERYSCDCGRYVNLSSESSCDSIACLNEEACIEHCLHMKTCCGDHCNFHTHCEDIEVNYKCKYEICEKCLEILSVETNNIFIKLDADSVENPSEKKDDKPQEIIQKKDSTEVTVCGLETQKTTFDDDKAQEIIQKKDSTEVTVCGIETQKTTIDDQVWLALTSDKNKKLDIEKSDKSEKKIEWAPTVDEVEHSFSRIRLYYENSSKSSSDLITRLDQLKQELFKLYRFNLKD